MGHIYVWNLDQSVFGKCDQEKLNDCAGVFLGLGVLMLNGLTDEAVRSLLDGYETKKKFYGDLKPEQIGYLFARYCSAHGIPEDTVRPSLTATGRKYFDIGRAHLHKNPKR